MKIYIEKSFHAGDERRQDLLNELDKLIGIKDETNDPFYFDPSDIDKIEQRSLDFLYTIEFYMDFPGILEIILGSTEKLARDKNFIYLIANHLEKDREMNLDKDRDHPVRQANLFGNRIRSLEEM